MLRSNRWLVCTSVALVLSGTCAPPTSHAQDSETTLVNDDPHYTTLKIFGPPLENSLNSLSINNRRMVTAWTENGSFALFQRFLHPIDFENAPSVNVTGLNDRGDIIGLLTPAGGQRPSIAFRYSLGELETISVGDDEFSPPLLNDINNHGGHGRQAIRQSLARLSSFRRSADADRAATGRTKPDDDFWDQR